MDSKYPHWYHGEEKVESYEYQASFQDRLLCLLGDEVLFSVDARICRSESFCGTLCFVGCDFIIVSTCQRGKAISMHVPIRMLRFIAPFKSSRRHRF
jgi:hypothetical protein